MTKERRARLNYHELMCGTLVGGSRAAQSVIKNWERTSGLDKDIWGDNIEGAQGEQATAKVLGLTWVPIVGDIYADDVGPYQVRVNRTRKTENMLLRPKDFEKASHKIYISVLSFSPEFIVLGWIRCSDCKRNEWLYEDEKPFWLVPRSALHDLDDLPEIM